MNTIADHKSLIDALGGNVEVARYGDWPAVRVGQWKQQNRIPPDYWPKIIEMAAERAVDGINSSWLMNAWAPRKNGASSDAEADAA